MPDGYFPPDRLTATLENGRQVPFSYLCLVCGQYHAYPEPCPGRQTDA